MKKYAAIFIIGFLLIFYAGYRVGLFYVNRWTVQHMLDQETFRLAARSAYIISELHDINLELTVDPAVACKIREVAIRQEDDWNKCKLNDYCLKNISDGYYSRVDKKILAIKGINCKK